MWRKKNYQLYQTVSSQGWDYIEVLQKNYELEMNLKQRKWQWGNFLWAFDVELVYTFLLYQQSNKMYALGHLLHNRFLEQIFLAWVASETNWATRYLNMRQMKVRGTCRESDNEEC